MKQWLVNLHLTPTVGHDPATFAYTASGADVTGAQVAVYAGSNIAGYRQVEVANAWNLLKHTSRNRNWLDDTAGAVYAGCPIDSAVSGSVTLGASLAAFSEDDVVIGLGSEISALGERLPFETSIDAVIDFAIESQFKVA